MPTYPTVPLAFERLAPEQMLARAESLRDEMARRRSVRHFSADPVPLDTIRAAIATASTAPSGAHKQPWTFALVTDPSLKSRIREAAEAEERAFYEQRATAEWLADLEPLGTTPDKPFLEEAPALIVVFAQAHARDGGRHYYVKESVGIASGMLLAALHHAGLATLTHTPSPMAFLADVLERPANERPFLLIPVGFPADDCEVPELTRKPLASVLAEYHGASPGDVGDEKIERG